jgi:hypothetical protein
MEKDLKVLAVRAIAALASEEMHWHGQEGCGDYIPSDELLDLLREAKRLSLTLDPPYRGHQWPEL